MYLRLHKQKRKTKMNNNYQSMYRQATTLQRNFKSYSKNQAPDIRTNMLNREMQSLTKDIASGKNSRTLDTRLRSIQTRIKQTQQPKLYGMPGQVNPSLTISQSRGLNRSYGMMQKSLRQAHKY